MTINVDELGKVPCGWQPIATAPKDGTPVLLWTSGRVGLFAYYDDGMKTISGKPMGSDWCGSIFVSETEEAFDYFGSVPLVGVRGAEDASHWMALPEGPKDRSR